MQNWRTDRLKDGKTDGKTENSDFIGSSIGRGTTELKNWKTRKETVTDEKTGSKNRKLKNKLQTEFEREKWSFSVKQIQQLPIFIYWRKYIFCLMSLLGRLSSLAFTNSQPKGRKSLTIKLIREASEWGYTEDIDSRVLELEGCSINQIWLLDLSIMVVLQMFNKQTESKPFKVSRNL